MSDASLAKITKLRALMVEHKIDAFMVPTADAHISEYVSDHDKRRAFISEFHGSAGTALITATEAFLWTDGRYFLQATKELPSFWTLMKQGLAETPTIQDWCVKNLQPGQVVGFDPYLLQLSQHTQFQEAFEDSEISFKAIEGKNLIDQVWTEQPPLAAQPIKLQPVEYAGEDYKSKITKIQSKMKDSKSFALLLCALDEVAWFLNLRGSDITFNPVFLSYVVVTLDKVHFFVERSKFNADVEFPADLVEIHPYEDILKFMATLKEKAVTAKAAKEPYKIWVDALKSNYATFNAIGFTTENEIKTYILKTSNPTTLAKSLKNDAEIEGFKQSHIRDGAAMVKFFSWFESQYSTLPSITADETTRKASPLNEFTVAEKVESFRKQQPKFQGLSFDSISSVGPNGAIIHYKPDETTSSPVTSGNVYLLDSGAQYTDGTTDITRTFYIPSQDRPTPTDFQIEMNTRVLKGHIAIATAIFPPQTMGPALDILARSSLWQVGTDFQHGLGHGVGSYLNVHEGPQGIAKMNRGGLICSTPLQVGMVVSNEPGYYHDGEFGIRIENLVYILPKETKYNKTGGHMTFANLTMVPIDRQLIDKSALTDAEIQWVNDYHAEVKAKVMPLVQEDQLAVAWLNKNTEPL